MIRCKTCGVDTTKRVSILPGATQCVGCLKSDGDVFRYVGYREACTESGKHLGGVERVIRTESEAELANQLTGSSMNDQRED